MHRVSRLLAVIASAPGGRSVGSRAASQSAPHFIRLGIGRSLQQGGSWQRLAAGVGSAVRAPPGSVREFHGAAVCSFHARGAALARRRQEEEEEEEEDVVYKGETGKQVQAARAPAEDDPEVDEDGDMVPERKGRKERPHPYPNHHNIPLMPISYTLELKQTVKVTRGGKVRKFSALVCVGNGKGAIAFGKGKHAEAAYAIHKATRMAHTWHRMEYVDLYDNRTVMHDTEAWFKCTKMIVLASKEGMGLRAPPVVRKMCECVGIEDIQVKCHGSRNTVAQVKAFWQALMQIRRPEEIAKMRGKMVVDTASLRAGYGLGATTFTLPGVDIPTIPKADDMDKWFRA